MSTYDCMHEFTMKVAAVYYGKSDANGKYRMREKICFNYCFRIYIAHHLRRATILTLRRFAFDERLQRKSNFHWTLDWDAEIVFHIFVDFNQNWRNKIIIISAENRWQRVSGIGYVDELRLEYQSLQAIIVVHSAVSPWSNWLIWIRNKLLCH